MNLISDRKSILLLIWLVAVTALTFPLFAWQLDYFRKPGPGYYEAFLLLSAALLLAGFLYARIRPTFARYEPFLFALFPVSLSLFHDARSTLVVLLMAASAYVLGGGVLHLLSLEADFAVETAFGLGILMSVLSWLGMAGVLYWQVILVIFLLPLAIFRGRWRSFRPSPETGSIPSWNSLAVVFGLIFLACSASVAIAPDLAFDVVRTHLPSVQYYAAQHRVAPLPLVPYSYFPQGMETLMASALALSSRAAAQAVPVLFLGLTALLCRSLGRRIGMDNSGAWMAALCAAALPFANWTGSVGKNDLMLACFEFASLYCLICWAETHTRNWLLAGAAFLGFACSIKYTAIYGVVPLVLLMLYGCWRSRRWVDLFWAATVAAVFGLIWPLRAWILTGNPVYPEHLGRSGSIQLAKASLPWTAKLFAFLKTPWTVHFHPIFASPLPAPVGIVLVLFLPAWFLGRSKWNTAARYCFFFAALYWLYWSAIWPVLRFGVAPLMMLAVLTISGVFSCYAGAKTWLRTAINLALVYSLLFSLSATMIMEINAPQIRFLAGRINADEYLRRVLPSYPSLDSLRHLSGPSDLVLSIGNCSFTYTAFPWNYECLSPRVPAERIRARLSELPFHFLILPSGFPPPVALKPPEYQDAAFSVYRVRSK